MKKAKKENKIYIGKIIITIQDDERRLATETGEVNQQEDKMNKTPKK